MNIQNLLSQMSNSTNPLALMMSMLTPNQKNQLENLKKKPTNEQAEEVARICNAHGISKEQLQNIINMLSNR